VNRLNGLLSFVLFVSSAAWVLASEIPERPLAFVKDEAQVLSIPLLSATEKILSDHASLTSETVLLLTLKNVGEGDLDLRAQEILEEWKLDSVKPPNTVLIMVDPVVGRIAVRTGIGLTGVLTFEEIERIQKLFFKPEWKNKNSERAVILAVLETLNGLESPIFSNHEVHDVYLAAGFHGGFEPIVLETRTERSWWIWSVLGFVVVGFVLIRAMSGEAHYTSQGWVRVSAWRGILSSLKRSPNKKHGQGIITGGGSSGHW
jgi:uncharacterized membrane protein YgcG